MAPPPTPSGFQGGNLPYATPWRGRWNIEYQYTDNGGGGPGLGNGATWLNPGGQGGAFGYVVTRGQPTQLQPFGVGLLINAHFEEYEGQPWLDPNTMSMLVGTFGFAGVNAGVVGGPAEWSGGEEVRIECTPEP